MKGSIRQGRLSFCGHPPKASAALMLVLVLSLLVGTFAATVVRRAAAERSQDRERQSVAVLKSAIDAVRGSGLTVGDQVELPIDASGRRVVRVQIVKQQDNEPVLRATLVQNNQPGIFIERTANP